MQSENSGVKIDNTLVIQGLITVLGIYAQYFYVAAPVTGVVLYI